MSNKINELAREIETLYRSNFDLFETMYKSGKEPTFNNSNSKLGKNVFEFNLLPYVTCNHEVCEGCYSIYNTLRYGKDINKNKILLSRAYNTYLSEYHLDYLKSYLFVRLLELDTLNGILHKGYIVRIHSHGDFNSNKEYAMMWYEFINKFVNTSFYGYSKDFETLNSVDFYSMDNVNFFASSGYINDMLVIPPKAIQEHYNIAWINENLNGGKSFKCPGKCTDCKNFCSKKVGVDVVFDAHGSGKSTLDKLTNMSKQRG